MARWERWENSEVAQSERWEGSEVAAKVGGGGGCETARQERWQSSEVASWEILCFIHGETKISSFYF